MDLPRRRGPLHHNNKPARALGDACVPFQHLPWTEAGVQNLARARRTSGNRHGASGTGGYWGVRRFSSDQAFGNRYQGGSETSVAPRFFPPSRAPLLVGVTARAFCVRAAAAARCKLLMEKNYQGGSEERAR